MHRYVLSASTEPVTNTCQPSPLIDPNSPQDRNNFFPNHFCDLNSDEYGRPYNGPFDHIAEWNKTVPKFPTPKPNYNFSRSKVNLKSVSKSTTRPAPVTIDQFNAACSTLITSDECNLKPGEWICITKFSHNMHAFGNTARLNWTTVQKSYTADLYIC